MVMAEVKELRESPGALYLSSEDFEGTLIVYSAIHVSDAEGEDDHIILTANQGQPKKLPIDGELREDSGTFFFDSRGTSYILSDFSESISKLVFSGLPLSKELAETSATKGIVTSVGVEDETPIAVYATMEDGKTLSWQDSSWVEIESIPEGQETMETGFAQAGMVTRAIDFGVEITLEEANIKPRKQ